MPGLDVRILGPLEVLFEDHGVALGGSRQRELFALLALNANATVSAERLIDLLWDEHPPATAAKTLQVHVSRLRKTLGRDDLLVTRDRGYRLTIPPDAIDATRFELLVDDARSAEHPELALGLLERALALWRGDPLADLASAPFAQPEIARLVDLRAAAHELLIDAKLALGRHAEVIGALEALVGEHPYREALRAQLMLALYRSERQADALQAYQDARRALVEDLGIEPGVRLRELEQAVLAQDPALAWVPEEAPADRAAAGGSSGAAGGGAGAAGVHARAPRRRLVSIVFADLVGSTGLGERLDPESLHSLLDRYTEVCGAVVERHGGSVEGFIGDAVVGVFGIAELHEDDALRAVRAAVELRVAGATLSEELEREHGIGIAIRLGVESGEVFVGGGTRRAPFAAGDAFNVAARLEGRAEPGEILLGHSTYELVADSVRAERLEPLALRGRREPVRAWRLIELAPAEPPATPLVGRGPELAELHAVYRGAVERRECRAVTVVGPAGIGKSRLVRELISELAGDAAVAIGRCRSYDEGATYRPLAEIVRELARDEPALTTLVGAQVAGVILRATGAADGAAQAGETSWAVRRLLERVATERPVVVAVDDVHWAEPTLLDLLEYLVAFSTGHPILVVAVGRPDLLETRPAWAAPLDNRELLLVRPLADDDARDLALASAARADPARDATDCGTSAAGPPADHRGRADTDRRGRDIDRIVEIAEGNPLFLEQLVAVGGDGPLPSTIHTVLAARLDRLDPGERAVLEHGSVQGRSFYAGAVADAAADPALDKHLVALVRHGLIRADASDRPGEDVFRFAHALIRETAYQSLPRRRRAELHEHAARWLAAGPDVADEPVGHHLGAAYRELAELGPVGEREQALAVEAADRLTAAADAALLRGDPPAGARLLEQSVALVEDPASLPRLGAVLLEAGRLADAAGVLTRAIECAAGDAPLEARARVELEFVRLQRGPQAGRDGVGEPTGDDGGAAALGAPTNGESARAQQAADAALAILSDAAGRSRALCLRARHAWLEGRVTDADRDWAEAADLAAGSGDEAALFEILDWRASAALFGPTPVPEAMRRCTEIRKRVAASPVAVALTCLPLAALHAMAGDAGAATTLLEGADEVLGQVGGLQAAVAQHAAIVEVRAGRPERATEHLRVGYDRLAAMGERALLAGTAGMLAQTLCATGDAEEATRYCAIAEQAAAADDLSAQVAWRSVRARLIARRADAGEGEAVQLATDAGEGEAVQLATDAGGGEAVRLATEAVRLAARTDLTTVHADALVDLGVVTGTEGPFREALELYRRKGDVVSARRVESNHLQEVQHAQVRQRETR